MTLSLFHWYNHKESRIHYTYQLVMFNALRNLLSFPQLSLSVSALLGGWLCLHKTLSKSLGKSYELMAFSWVFTGRWSDAVAKIWELYALFLPNWIVPWFIETTDSIFILLRWICPFNIHDYFFCNYKETNFLFSTLTLWDYSKHWWRENEIMVKWKQKKSQHIHMLTFTPKIMLHTYTHKHTIHIAMSIWRWSQLEVKA